MLHLRNTLGVNAPKIKKEKQELKTKLFINKTWNEKSIYKLDKRDLRFASYLSKISNLTTFKGLVTAIAHRRRVNIEKTPLAAYAHIYRMSVLLDFKKSSPRIQTLPCVFYGELTPAHHVISTVKARDRYLSASFR
ncbi:hypothetical protein AVEN_162153-1 [Araneus ventricosus]|uniref:Uncharacterized protein n=1 Tax=Araneus ventricosus TaxID=182803 RepID=A0A4Y2SIP2_ARAVE|nr:hypothetical protein AVEN_162153-1 [Araneus ventricosus]